MLNVKQLNFSYNKNSKNIVLNDINFELKENKIYALLGKNGAGKTTLFKCILRMLKNYNGDVFVYNKNTRNMTAKEIAKNISYIPQQRDVSFSYSVLDTILMGLASNLSIYQMPKDDDAIKVDEILKLLKIEHLKYKSYNNISGGEKQLVLIARAIIQNAKIILMDEPTSALDYNNQHHVMKIIHDLKNKGYTILISCHSPQLVLNYTDEIIAIKNGSILIEGKTEEVLNDNLIREIYNMDTKIIKDECGYAIIPRGEYE